MLSYIDPGSGSLLTQMAVAGVAGAAVAVKLGWRKTAALLDGRRRNGKGDRNEGDTEAAD